MMANVRIERLLKIPAEPGLRGPELRIPGAAAQTRIVSMAKIRLDRRKSTRLFKGIICDDISEFESYMPSHAVQSPPAQMWRSGSMPSCPASGDKKALGRRKRPRALGLERVRSLAIHANRRQPAIFGQKKPSVLHRGLEADRSHFLLINAQIAASYMARAGPVSSGVEARACPLQQLQKTQGGMGCFRIYRARRVRRFRPRKM
jgi:hypothetical protein